MAPQARYHAARAGAAPPVSSANAGRLILLLAPGQPYGLEDLLLDWGVVVDDDLIYDTGTQNMTEEGELLLRALRRIPSPRR